MYGGLARETGHAHRPHLSNRNITPEELAGLEAVLKLTERVADQVGSYTYAVHELVNNNIYIN